MKRAIVLTIFLFVAPVLPLIAQPPQLQFDIPIVDWPETASIRQACLAPDGILVAAKNDIGDGQSVLLLAKVGFNGELRWMREHGQTWNSPSFTASDLASTRNGGCLMVGRFESYTQPRIYLYDAWGDSTDRIDPDFYPSAAIAYRDGYMVTGSHTEQGYDGSITCSDFACLSISGFERWREIRAPGMWGSRSGHAVIPVGDGEYAFAETGLTGFYLDMVPFVDITIRDQNGNALAAMDLDPPNYPSWYGWVGTIVRTNRNVATILQIDDGWNPLTHRMVVNTDQGELIGDFNLPDMSPNPVSMLESRNNGYILLSKNLLSNDSLHVIALDAGGSELGRRLLTETPFSSRPQLISLPDGGYAALYQAAVNDGMRTRFARFLPPEVPYHATVTSPAELIELPSSGGEVLVDLQASHTLPMVDDVRIDLEIELWGGGPDSVAGWIQTLEPGEVFEQSGIPVDFSAADRDGFYRITVRTSNQLQTTYAEDHVFVQKGPITGVPDAAEGNAAMPETLELTAFPNPFNGIVEITLNLPAVGTVRVEIVNILGQQVAMLADGLMHAGTQTLAWNAEDAPSGVYLVRAIHESGTSSVRKVILLK
ncbi:T9SS type A sorting domain-containing protein [bacterium]|nr:T9SS type A sorting domain-containing protein [bacterium]